MRELLVPRLRLGTHFLEALPPHCARPDGAEPRGRGFPGRAWEPEELRDKSCAHAAKYLSNKEETTQLGQAAPVSRNRPLYHLPGRKAFPQRREPKTRCAKSCIRLWARGGYQALSAPRVLVPRLPPGNALSWRLCLPSVRGRASRSWVPRQEPGN